MLKNINYPYFQLQNSDSITSTDLKNLRKFYAPILGSDAILLYEYFRDLTYSENEDSGYHDYDSLTYFLNMDLKSLNKARIKLESVSLISTFIDERNRKTLFVIEKPLDTSGIKKNIILANKLVNTVGKQNFDRLVGKERNIVLNKAKYLLEASAKFEDVFYEENDISSSFDMEIDASQYNTTIINDKIQQKLNLDSFNYPNPYEAILKTDSRFFYSQVSGQIPTERIIDLIKEAREAQMSDPCINLIFFYAFEVNNKINYSYVKKIIQSLIKKEITSFKAIEKYLDNLIKIRKEIAVSKKDLYKASYIEALQKDDNYHSNAE